MCFLNKHAQTMAMQLPNGTTEKREFKHREKHTEYQKLVAERTQMKFSVREEKIRT